MSDLKTALEGAAGDGIISQDQATRLLPYLVERNIGAGPVVAAIGASRSRDDDLPNALEDSEAPRFVRGFHDILITIGIVVLLVGLWGTTVYYGPLPAIIIMAELLIRRQRLALPAVALTIALVQWIMTVMLAYLRPGESNWSVAANAMALTLPFPPLLALFYWRYRVPLSLAALLLSLFALVLAAIFYVLALATDSSNVAVDYTLLTLCIMFAAALGAFAVAMWFDLSDPERKTRRSDVAFWMHLATAPALLYTTILLVFKLEDINGSVTVFGGATLGGYTQALIVVLIVLVMMIVGLIIDRRAFVTAGLTSLGLAIGALLRQNNAGIDKVSFIVLMIVGLIVLVIGVGWPHLRRAVLQLLPASMQMRLPALR